MSKREEATETVDLENINTQEEVDSSTQECSDAPNEEQVSDNMADSSDKECDIEAQLSVEVAEWKDRYARLSAEFDNYRKRTLKEKMELIASAGEDVIKSVLSVVDDFDRAGAAIEKSDDIVSAREGVSLIHKRLLEVLKMQNVVELDALGSELNTDFHDAIANFPVDDADQKGKIIDVVEKGYTMNDKVIRFAKVVVGE